MNERTLRKEIHILAERVAILESIIYGIKQVKLEEVKTIDLNIIVEVICDFYEMTPDVVTNHRRWRKREVIRARHMAIYFACVHTKLTLTEIAEKFNYKDHSTVIHARNMIIEFLDINDKEVVKEHAALQSIIHGRIDHAVNQRALEEAAAKEPPRPGAIPVPHS